MPKYIISSESPITARELNRPDLPDWEVGGGPIIPERPKPPEDWERPSLPPREDWPPLPPWFQPGVGLPIPPTVEHPMVPVEPEDDIDPPDIWPPIERPSLPDLSGKTLALARIYVSRHVNFLTWVVIDHEEAKTKWQAIKAKIKDKMPAGGVGGRPPQRPGNP